MTEEKKTAEDKEEKYNPANSRSAEDFDLIYNIDLMAKAMGFEFRMPNNQLYQLAFCMYTLVRIHLTNEGRVDDRPEAQPFLGVGVVAASNGTPTQVQ